jgi:uncharacterized protein (DUF2132 family)
MQYIRPNFRIKKELHDKFKKKCFLNDLSMQSAINLLIKKWVEKDG